jgi:hypothetical protein
MTQENAEDLRPMASERDALDSLLVRVPGLAGPLTGGVLRTRSGFRSDGGC